jgi:hypothetical protein
MGRPKEDTEDDQMPTFLYAYRDPKCWTLGADSLTAWSAWYQGIGGDLVDRGNPVREVIPLGNCGPGTVLGGFSLVTADDLQAAVGLAKGCPGLRTSGGVEVGRIFELWPERTPDATR